MPSSESTGSGKESKGAVAIDPQRDPLGLGSKEYGALSAEERSQLATFVAQQVGFGERHTHHWFDGYDADVDKALQAHADRREGPVGSIYLAGKVGAGKTTAMANTFKHFFLTWAAGAEQAVAHYLPGFFLKGVFLFSHAELCDIFRDEFKDSYERSHWATFHDVSTSPFLLIDDLCTPVDTDYSVSRLEQLIQERWRNKRLTWITSNISRKDMRNKTKFPEWQRIQSLLFDLSYMAYVETNKPDRRKDVKGRS